MELYNTYFENEYIVINDGSLRIKEGCTVDNLKFSLDIYKQMCVVINNFNSDIS